MLGSLSGMVSARLDNRLLVEVGGVGYWIQTGSWQPEGEITCYLHQHIREDLNELYGFVDLLTLDLFEKLIGISGIGPKAGLALLSVGSLDQIKQAISQGDVSFLSTAPGIGQKAAQKIILELEKKISYSSDQSVSQGDVVSALESLGYKATDLRPLLGEIPPEHTTLDAQIKWLLQQLAK